MEITAAPISDTRHQWNPICQADGYRIERWGWDGDMRAVRDSLIDSRIVPVSGEAANIIESLAHQLAQRDEQIEGIRGWFSDQTERGDMEAEGIASALEEEGLL